MHLHASEGGKAIPIPLRVDRHSRGIILPDLVLSHRPPHEQAPPLDRDEVSVRRVTRLEPPQAVAYVGVLEAPERFLGVGDPLQEAEGIAFRQLAGIAVSCSIRSKTLR